ncbi:MAG: response regulator transcription factor [Burkholderiales bacterium]|nr:response regulator transcription factor [Burkholderiales bacterium]
MIEPRNHLLHDPSAQAAALPSCRPTEAACDVLVVDDHDLLRMGVRALLNAHGAGCARPARLYEARTLADGLDQYRRHRPQIAAVLLDLHLPDAYGMAGLDAFLRVFPDAPVAVLSGDNHPEVIDQALAHGARAYLPKSGDLSLVMEHLRCLGVVVTPSAPSGASAPSASSASLPSASPRGLGGDAVHLTPRQLDVLESILSGQSNREIAVRLQLSEGTVKNHVSTLLLSFGVRSRAQLISLLR